MSNEFRKTAVAATSIGVAESYLISLIRRKAIVPPQKDSSGDYIWTPENIAAAKAQVDETQQKRNEWRRQREEKRERKEARRVKHAAKIE
jgi:hypothetical protein